MDRTSLIALALIVSTNMCVGQTSPNESVQANLEEFAGKAAGEKKELAAKIIFHWCPAGSFTIGEGKNTSAVELSNGFWLGETEITQDQWQKLMSTTPWNGPGTKFVKEGPNYPAMYVSYDAAVEFCKKLTAQEREVGRLPSAWRYSLPTEAQWEYACRAGTTTKFSFGDDASKIDDYAWIQKNTYDRGEKYGHRVGLKKANPWGLKDMHGNLYEWALDWNTETLIGGRDPQGPPQGTQRVLRSGGWGNSANVTRSAFRAAAPPDALDYAVGFRLAAVRSDE